MIGFVMVLVGVVMAIAGFTGRWRALLHATFPTFAARLGVARNG